MKFLLSINEETFGRENPSNVHYHKREAARAVLTNKKGGIYLLHVTSMSHHKLPGGGIDKGEDTVKALQREIFEEVGCAAVINDEIGEIVEYRPYEDGNLQQHSYCYLATQEGELGLQNLEEDEIEMGHDLVIAASIDEAIRTLENDTPNDTEGEYIRLRDLTFLRAARNSME